MAGSFYRRCTKCRERSQIPEGERRCPTCGSTDATWYYHLSYTDPSTGRRKQSKKGGFASKRDAQATARKIFDDLDRGRTVDAAKITVGDLLDEWLETRRMTVKATTLRPDRRYIETHIKPRIGDLPLARLTAPRLNALYAEIRDDGRVQGTEPLSPATVRNAHKLLRRALEDARRWGYVRFNVADVADPPRASEVKNARKKAIRTWTGGQVDAFACWLEDHRPTWLFVLWFVAISTGMRRSELLGLGWQDVDLDRRRLAIRRVWVHVEGGAQFREAPKSQHGYRTIRFGRSVERVLRAWRVEWLEARMAAGPAWQEHDAVFARLTPGSRGQLPGMPWHPDYVSRCLTDAIIESGLPRIRPLQDMRHSHATILLLAGEHTKVVQERLGHHSHSFTSDSYQHTIDGLDEMAADRFEDAVFNRDDEEEAGSDG